jgi:hypothetical protein
MRHEARGSVGGVGAALGPVLLRQGASGNEAGAWYGSVPVRPGSNCRACRCPVGVPLLAVSGRWRVSLVSNGGVVVEGAFGNEAVQLDGTTACVLYALRRLFVAPYGSSTPACGISSIAGRNNGTRTAAEMCPPPSSCACLRLWQSADAFVVWAQGLAGLAESLRDRLYPTGTPTDARDMSCLRGGDLGKGLPYTCSEFVRPDISHTCCFKQLRRHYSSHSQTPACALALLQCCLVTVTAAAAGPLHTSVNVAAAAADAGPAASLPLPLPAGAACLPACLPVPLTGRGTSSSSFSLPLLLLLMLVSRAQPAPRRPTYSIVLQLAALQRCLGACRLVSAKIATC